MFTQFGDIMKELVNQRNFTEEFKRFVVSEVESGKRNIRELNFDFGIQGHSTILKWCRKYGGHQYPMIKRTPNDLPPSLKNDEASLLRNQVKLLQRELDESRLKQATLETLIDIAEKHYFIQIKKNSGGKRLNK